MVVFSGRMGLTRLTSLSNSGTLRIPSEVSSPQGYPALGAHIFKGSRTLKATDIDVKAIEASQLAQAKWKIPASISLAQYGEESGWGQHAPGNNPFGIKAHAGEPSRQLLTREVARDGSVYTLPQSFRVYVSLEEAFDDHARLLATCGAYTRARAFLPAGGSPPTAADVDAFVDALTGVYATDRSYGTKLKGLIHDLNLTQFDTVAA